MRLNITAFKCVFYPSGAKGSSTKQQSNRKCSHFRYFPVSLFAWFLESKRVSNLTPLVPSVQHFFSGVVIHHGVVLIQVCELYAGVPLCSCLGVVSKVDGSGLAVIGVDTVNHSTNHKSIAHRTHWL